MPDKRLYPHLFYIFLVLLVCISLWHLAPDSSPPLPSIPTYTLFTSNSSYVHPSLPLDDYQQLIDLRNFSFTTLAPPCNESAPPLLIVLVHSSPAHFRNRQVIRRTWGGPNPNVKLVFVVGRAKDMEDVGRESAEWGDVLQGNFIDSYRNLTYKHVSVLKYAIYHCPQAKYVLKTDDDVFVNMPQLLSFLGELSPYGGARMLFGSLRSNAAVMRTYRSKWRVSFKEYPHQKYPPHCPGYAILYSPDVVFDLYREAQKTPYFWIDDVHITGTLADKIQVRISDVTSLVLTKDQVRRLLAKGEKRSFLFGYNLNLEDMEVLWEKFKG